MSLFSLLSDLDESEDLHLGRLLVLLNAFAGQNGTDSIEGLTKLAKLDFLLRYPVYLERALKARNADPQKAKVTDHERKNVESSMVRFRYGPWDHRYRRFINLLVAKGLANVEIKGRTINISLTSEGLEVAKKLCNEKSFIDTVSRAKLLKNHFDLSATRLMKFVYETFPEIGSLSLGKEIG